MKTPLFATCAALCIATSGNLAMADNAVAPQTASDNQPGSDARIKWWRDARFGMFLHYGLYAIPGKGEWAEWNEPIPPEEYAKLAGEFTAEHFDAKAIAQLAKDSGAKYVVLTSRHHDGFCLFDDKGNDYTTVKTAAKRDLIAEYVKAVRDAGLKVGIYYSPLDWRYPGYFMPDFYTDSSRAMRAQYQRQMDELIHNYGPIDIFWFDGGEQDWLSFGGDWKGIDHVCRPQGEHFKGKFNWGHAEVYAKLQQFQPRALLNTRADMPEDFKNREGDKAMGDYDDSYAWELCTTIAGAWGYELGVQPKSLRKCIELLTGAAGRDGNLLLNVGPRPDGTIDPEQAARMREIGAWLGKYGESIYCTRGGPYLPASYGVSTRRGNVVYIHILAWPDGDVVLPKLPAKVVKNGFLTGGAVRVTQNADSLTISMDAKDRDALDTIVVLELDAPVVGVIPAGK